MGDRVRSPVRLCPVDGGSELGRFSRWGRLFWGSVLRLATSMPAALMHAVRQVPLTWGVRHH